MNTTTTSKNDAVQRDPARAPWPTARAATLGSADPARQASLSGAADGAVIGLVIGAVFAIATIWPMSLAALAGGVIVGAAWGAALAYLSPRSRMLANNSRSASDSRAGTAGLPAAPLSGTTSTTHRRCLVIDDRNRATLAELERHLRRYDPRYLADSDAEAASMPAQRSVGRAAPVYSMLLMLSGALALLLVTMGWFADAAVLAAITALARHVQRRGRGSRRRRPRRQGFEESLISPRPG